MNRKLRRLFAAAGGALVASLAVAPVAYATHVGCGTVITTDTVLDSDVGPCTGDGIIVKNNNLTLDLNGHTVSGTLGAFNDGIGILLDHNTQVTVKNGTVQHFDAAVAVIKGTKNTVTGVTAKDNIGNAQFSDFGDGIAIVSSHDNTITNNTVERNGPFSGISIFNQGPNGRGQGTGGLAQKNVIDGNTVRDNNCAVGCPPRNVNDDIGIRLEPGTHLNTVTNNTVSGSALEGIRVFSAADDNVVSDNTVTGNGFHNKAHRKGDGVRIDAEGHHGEGGGAADDNIVERNVIRDNALNGIIVSSSGNTFTGNTALNNNVTSDPLAFDLNDRNTVPPCDSNVWTNNTFGTASQTCIS